MSVISLSSKIEGALMCSIMFAGIVIVLPMVSSVTTVTVLTVPTTCHVRKKDHVLSSHVLTETHWPSTQK